MPFVDRTRKWLAVLAALVVVNVALAGLLYVRLNTRLPDHMAERPGFTAATVHAPLLPSGDPHNWDARPEATTRFPPGYSMQARWSADLAYAGWVDNHRAKHRRLRRKRLRHHPPC